MTPEGSPRSTAAVLEANLEWIRMLARALAKDPEAADELAQETCVAALGAPAGKVESFRPWIAAVMRNLWRQRGRSEERRRAREDRSERPDRTSDDLVLEVVLFRELAQHVLELPEPYQGAILMRFFGNQEPRVIADRLGTTPATIQNRITRGLSLLRERLDRSRGGREAWLSVLIPCIRPSAEGAAAAALGGIAVNLKIAVAAALVLAVVALFVFRGLEAPPPPPSPPIATETPAKETAEPAPAHTSTTLSETAAVEASSIDRAPLAPAVVAPAPAPPADSGPFRVRGRVLDATGSPVSGLAMRSHGGGPILATSKDGGWFEFETQEDVARCVSADPAWTTVRSAALRRNAKIEPLLVVARALDVQGTVQDVRGAPLAGARVHLELPSGFEARFDRPLESSLGMGWNATSDEHGRFSLPGIPSVDGGKLSAVLEGYARAEIDEPVFGAADVVLVLAPPPPAPEGSLRGRVVDDVGTPVPRARVFLGLASVATDERGEFAVGFAAP